MSAGPFTVLPPRVIEHRIKNAERSDIFYRTINDCPETLGINRYKTIMGLFSIHYSLNSRYNCSAFFDDTPFFLNHMHSFVMGRHERIMNPNTIVRGRIAYTRNVVDCPCKNPILKRIMNSMPDPDRKQKYKVVPMTKFYSGLCPKAIKFGCRDTDHEPLASIEFVNPIYQRRNRCTYLDLSVTNKKTLLRLYQENIKKELQAHFVVVGIQETIAGYVCNWQQYHQDHIICVLRPIYEDPIARINDFFHQLLMMAKDHADIGNDWPTQSFSPDLIWDNNILFSLFFGVYCYCDFRSETKSSFLGITTQRDINMFQKKTFMKLKHITHDNIKVIQHLNEARRQFYAEAMAYRMRQACKRRKLS